MIKISGEKTEPENVRVGIVGAGRSAAAHAQVVSEVDGLVLVGISDVDVRRGGQLAREYEAAFFADVSQLADEVDAVIIANVNFAHYEVAQELLSRKLNILCEKPFCLNATQSEDLARTVPEGIIACVGFNYRFLASTRIFREYIDSGLFGRIRCIRGAFLRDSALRRKEFTWRDGPDAGGTSGALGDLGVHFIDLFSHFFASEIALDSLSVTRQLFVAEKQHQRVCVDDYAEVSGGLLNGIPFELRASKVTAPAECGYFLSIEGEAMSLECRSQLSGRMEVTLVDRDGHRQRRCPARTLQDPDNEVHGWLDSLVEQAEAWRNSIRGQKLSTNPATFYCGHRTQSVLEHLLQYPIDVHEVADALQQ